jgi:hypothetical protein
MAISTCEQEPFRRYGMCRLLLLKKTATARQARQTAILINSPKHLKNEQILFMHNLSLRVYMMLSYMHIHVIHY